MPSPHRFLCALILSCAAVSSILSPATAAQTAELPPRFTPETEEFVRNFKPGGQDFAGQARILSPEETLRQLKPSAGYQVELVANEPMIRQPIDLQFDDRGRLWVMQYLQYPFPAGLTVTAYDQYLRATFQQRPAAPPHHVRGADRITILEDKDGDGRFESAKDFVDGLNMATSIALAPDGVWVLQTPYLLFYRDANGDDIPDGDPEVHLSGFGMEDTHALANSLHLGPDGWLYGAQGSTTTLDIQGTRLLGQCIWRYHPSTKVFEIFAEGGGNTFSFEFDKYGRAYSGTNNGSTRGLHYVQGATYIKGWTKHGPAMNPFIFGNFEHMAHQGYLPRFPQTFLFYEGGLMPDLEGEVVVGMSLTNRVQSSRIEADTSTFRTVDHLGLVTTEDKTFRPVDIEAGPDGAIYLADWSDVRLSHLNPNDTWDKSHGRIFRIVPEKFISPARPNLRQATTEQLLTYLTHPNRWYRERAHGLLSKTPDAIAPRLKAMLAQPGEEALAALWLLHVREEINDRELRSALKHPSPHVRRWAVRLLGDKNSVSSSTRLALVELARTEPDREVRSQLASSAKRLPASQAFPILRELVLRTEDTADKHLPLLLWWAIESKADTGREELIALLQKPAIWQSSLFRTHLASRIGQRYTADQGPRKYFTLTGGVYSSWIIERAPEYLLRNLHTAAQLLQTAPTPADANLLVKGMAEGLTGRPVDYAPADFKDEVAALWRTQKQNVPLMTLAARIGNPEAREQAIALAEMRDSKPEDRQQLIDLFSAIGTPDLLPLVAGPLQTETNEQRRSALLAALGGFQGVAAAQAILEFYPKASPRLQIVAQRMLSERSDWAKVMLRRINDGSFNPGVISASNRTLLQAHTDAEVTSLLTTYLKTATQDPAARRAQQLFDQGKTLYGMICATCHLESGQGQTGLAPALVGSPWITKGTPALARIALHGKESPGRGLTMPPLKQLEDVQLASVITYISREFGNSLTSASPEEVAQVRAATGKREKPWSDSELTEALK